MADIALAPQRAKQQIREATTWDQATDWRQPEAALHGSSHYDLPPVLRWFSANIGVHHVHHLSSGVPFYRLPEVLRTYPELREVGRLTLWRSFACVHLALWDEETRQFVCGFNPKVPADDTVLLARVLRYSAESYLGVQMGEHSTQYLTEHARPLAVIAGALFIALYVLIRLTDHWRKPAHPSGH